MTALQILRLCFGNNASLGFNEDLSLIGERQCSKSHISGNVGQWFGHGSQQGAGPKAGGPGAPSWGRAVTAIRNSMGLLSPCNTESPGVEIDKAPVRRREKIKNPRERVRYSEFTSFSRHNKRTGICGPSVPHWGPAIC